MRNDNQQKPHRGSSAMNAEQDSNDWGVAWIQSCRQIRDEPRAKRKRKVVDQIAPLENGATKSGKNPGSNSI